MTTEAHDDTHIYIE